jgi:hypothetical protein
MDDVWLNLIDLATVVGVTRKAIHKRLGSCVARRIKGGRGGQGGIRCQVLLSSLPDRWQITYQYWFDHLPYPWQAVVLRRNRLKSWESICLPRDGERNHG